MGIKKRKIMDRIKPIKTAEVLSFEITYVANILNIKQTKKKYNVFPARRIRVIAEGKELGTIISGRP